MNFRSVECSDEDIQCDIRTKPRNTQRCDLRACPRWITGQWGQARQNLSSFVKTIKLNLLGIEESLLNRGLSTNCWKIGEMVLKTTKGRGNLPSLYIFPSRLNKTRVDFSLLTY